jgi:hypothetical protein
MILRTNLNLNNGISNELFGILEGHLAFCDVEIEVTDKHSDGFCVLKIEPVSGIIKASQLPPEENAKTKIERLSALTLFVQNTILSSEQTTFKIVR